VELRTCWRQSATSAIPKFAESFTQQSEFSTEKKQKKFSKRKPTTFTNCDVLDDKRTSLKFSRSHVITFGLLIGCDHNCRLICWKIYECAKTLNICLLTVFLYQYYTFLFLQNKIYFCYIGSHIIYFRLHHQFHWNSTHSWDSAFYSNFFKFKNKFSFLYWAHFDLSGCWKLPLSKLPV